MPDSDAALQVDVTANLAAFQAGLTQAEGKIATFSGQVNSANAGMTSSANVVTSALNNVGAAGAAAGEKTAFSFREAKGAAVLLGEEVGVKLNRHLSSILARSETIGPLLSKAFSIIAIVAFAEVAERVYNKIIEVTDSMAGLTAAVKKQYEEVIKYNEYVLTHFDATKIGQAFVQATNAQIDANDRNIASLKTLQTSYGGFDGTVQSLTVDAAAYYVAAKQIHDIEQENVRLTGLRDEQLKRLNETRKKDAEEAARDAKKEEQVEKAAARHFTEIHNLRDRILEKAAREREAYLDKEQKDDEKLTDNKLKNWLHELEEENKAQKKAIDERMEMLKGEAEQAIEVANGNLAVEKENEDFLVAIGKVSAKQRIADIQQFERDSYNAHRQALQNELILASQEPKEHERILKELEKLDAGYRLTQQRLDHEAALQRIKTWQSIFQSINTAVHTSLLGVIQGTQSVSQAMQKLAQDILVSFVDSFVQIGLEWLQQHVFMRAVSAIFHIQQQAMTASSAISEHAVHAAVNSAAVVSDAAVAFANAYAAYAWNPALALGMGLQAEATVLSVLPQASAAGGAIVPRDQSMFLHADEMVLPAKLSRGVQSLVDTGRAGGAAPAVHVHISALDGADVMRVLTSNRKALAKVLRGMHRDNLFARA